MRKYLYKIKSYIKQRNANKKANKLGTQIWQNSPETLIYSPVIDFAIIPQDFNLLNLTSNKVENLVVEVGTGNGDFLSYLSKQYKTSLIVGFEIAKTYFIKTKNNLMRELCLNAKVAHQDAYIAIRDKFTKGSISKIFINFPDPWPKKKHWRRRFLTPEKFPMILGKLQSGGEIIFVTDHMEYSEFVQDLCRKFSNYVQYRIETGVPKEYPETKYFRKWKSLGKKEYKTITIKKIR